MKSLLLLLLVFSFLLSFSSAEQCGRQAGGALCPNGLCCSSFGFCGVTEAYCKLPGCQSQCTPDDTPSPSPPPPSPPPPPPSPSPSPPPPSPPPPSPPPPSPSPPAGPPPPDPTGGLTDIITRSQFDEILNHRNDGDCPGKGFYTYDAFIAAAKMFHNFGMVGDTASRKRELAAFFGQTYYQSGGYCYKEEVDPPSNYCFPQKGWPCAPGKGYYGRGPMMLTGNYNYGVYGLAIGADLLNNPDLVSTNPVIAFRVAILFWMKPSAPGKPRSHDVINGLWYPSKADIAAQRFPGYGVITNIINGGEECGHGPDKRNGDRIDSYVRCCYILGATPGPNIDCSRQRPFDSANFLKAAI